MMHYGGGVSYFAHYFAYEKREILRGEWEVEGNAGCPWDIQDTKA
jgi:hypothetical protein